MFSTRQFEHPDAPPLEAMIAEWLAASLAGPDATSTPATS
jgi:hypothetical protein